MILSTTKNCRGGTAAICLFAILWNASAAASPLDLYGKRITELAYEGARTVDTSLIRRVSGIDVGSVFNAAVPQEAIRHLYALSLFEDIIIQAEPASDRGVRVIIQVLEYPRLSEIVFQGNHKLHTDDLRDKIALVPNQIVSRDQIKQAQQTILEHYKEKGFFGATVEYQTELRADLAIDIILVIDESRKVKIKKVTILGAKKLDAGKVRGKMSNKQDNWIRSGNYKPEEFPEDLEKIVTYYKKEGYLDAAVLHDTVFYNESIGGLEIQITVHEGKKYYFGDVTFSGYTLFTEDALRRNVTFAPGEVWSDRSFDKTMEAFYAMLHEEGRLYSHVLDTQSPRDSVVDIHFKFVENEPARIRYVNIIGNGKTKDKVIRREMSLYPGDVYRRSNLERSMRDLMVLNYFENLVPDIRPLPNGDVDIVLEVMEKSTGQISLGGGYSGQDKFVGTAGFSVPNFLGNGQTVSINVERGGRRSSFDISLTEPWFRDTRTSVGIDFFSLSRRSFDGSYNEDRSGLGLRVGRRLRWPDRYTSVFLRGRIQDLGYSDFEDRYDSLWQFGAVGGPDPGGDWPQRLSALSVTIQRDSRDRAQFATKGSTVSATFEYAGDAVGGYWHYHKEIFTATKYLQIYKELALVFKAKWGFITPTVTADLVPFLEQFQVGGTNGDGMVRGYDDGTVGSRIITGKRDPVTSFPDLPRGYDVGVSPGSGSYSSSGIVSYDRSESMTIYNLELQIPIAPPQIYGILFADAGRGFDGTKKWQFSRGLWRSMGLGGRMVVPGVGTIGFDMAYGFDGGLAGGWRPHFQIGRGF